MEFKRLFESGKIGPLRIKNRIVMAPMGTNLASDTGAVSQRIIDHYAARARGGVGMIIVEATCVDAPIGKGFEREMRLDNNRFIAGHFELTEVVHRYGAKIALQLHHAGRHSTLEITEGQQPVAPSAVKESSPVHSPGVAQPRELTIEEIQELIERFASMAVRARSAGYDAVEIHGAHGYLVHQFFSPRSNKRLDRYGGSLENRARFATETIMRVKERVGRSFPVIFRLTAEETTDEGGFTLEDGKAFARYVEAAGVDAIHVTMGTFEDKDDVSRNVCPQSYPQGWRIPYAEAIKKELKIPVIVVGAIREPEFAENIIKEGRVDFVALGRGLLADPDWPNKAMRGEVDNIRKCPSCNYCAFTVTQGTPLRCALNPAVGREREFAEFHPALVKKKVMVVGSGPGGMEAARVAALRGFEVSLYEKGKSLGDGQLRLCAASSYKEKMNWVREYLATQVQKLDIEIHLETEITPQLVLEKSPDVLIVATGAKPSIPEIPGVKGKNVVTAHDVLAGKVEIYRRRVAVLGQFSTGADVADFLAEKENEVTIIARSPAHRLAQGALPVNRIDLMVRLRGRKNVTILNECKVKEISDKGVTIIGREGRERFLEVDYVILAQGVTPVRELEEQLKGKLPEVYTIGDAVEPRNIASAIYEGAIVARRI